jgi:hypothetical protein
MQYSKAGNIMELGLVNGDSSLIGFVVRCLFNSAIEDKDIRDWSMHMIEKYDDLPLYMYDLPDYKKGDYNLPELIGFATSWKFSEKDSEALYGIAYKRGFEPYDCSLTKEEAIKRLEECPHIEKKFRDTFPFIDF